MRLSLYWLTLRDLVIGLLGGEGSMVGFMATSTMAVGKAIGAALGDTSLMYRLKMVRPAYFTTSVSGRNAPYIHSNQGPHVWMEGGDHFADALQVFGALVGSKIVAPGINGMKGSTSCYCFRRRGCHAVGSAVRSTFWRLVQRLFSSFSRPLGCIL